MRQFFLLRWPNPFLPGTWRESTRSRLAYDGPITADEVKRQCIEDGYPESITVEEINDLVARVHELEYRIEYKDAFIFRLTNNNKEEK